MKRIYYMLVVAIVTTFSTNAQEQMKNQLPYYEIPKNPSTYTAGTVAARMIDGLGFRYYWATEGLREEDLLYKPSKDGRTTEETIDHILGLSNVILKSATQTTEEKSTVILTFEEKRKKTLENLKKASDIFMEVKDLAAYDLVFSEKFKLPFWNNINGPIADAIWHSGQLVMMRRSSGNPMPKGVNVLMGTKK